MKEGRATVMVQSHASWRRYFNRPSRYD